MIQSLSSIYSSYYFAIKPRGNKAIAYRCISRTGKILHALGNLSWSQGRFDESLDYHNRVFVQYMKTLGASHHRTADVQHRLAMHYVRLDRLAEAE